jgi:hypothetical protein
MPGMLSNKRVQGVEGKKTNSTRTTAEFALRYAPAAAGWDAKMPKMKEIVINFLDTLSVTF